MTTQPPSRTRTSDSQGRSVVSTGMSYLKRTKPALGAVVAAVLALTVTACGDDSKDSDSKSSEETSEQENAEGGQQGPEPDLDDVPDVVAEVNGEEVTKDEFAAVYEPQFQQAAMQAQMGGGEAPDEEKLQKQTADGLVDTELLRQEAESRDISASEKDVDAKLGALAKQNQMGSAKEFLAALEKQGTSEDVVRGQVETQVMLERLVQDEGGAVKPTEAELRKLYDQAVQQQKKSGQQGGQQAIPPFAKVKPQLVQQAKSDKQNKTAQTMVKELREDADITINL